CSPSEEVIISRQLERIAIWIVEWERNAGQSVERRFNEMKGEVLLKVRDAPALIIRARADRIDRNLDGSCTLLDYKTGQIPAKKDIAAGRAPQLPLQGWMMMQGGFEGLRDPAKAFYIQLKGYRSHNRCKVLQDFVTLSQQAGIGLEALIARFCSTDAVFFYQDGGPYDQSATLARFHEWGASDSNISDSGAGNQ
ncbi:MAG: PD-(D/E)XK nuclease family protein, partial [Pseudomonadota bacterium]